MSWEAFPGIRTSPTHSPRKANRPRLLSAWRWSPFYSFWKGSLTELPPKPCGRQRTDSTHVVAAVRDLNRLERVIETLRAALNVLATAAPDWLRSHIPAEWVDRYGKRAEEYNLPSGEKQRQALAEQVGRDGDALLVALWSTEAPTWMKLFLQSKRSAKSGFTVFCLRLKVCAGARRQCPALWIKDLLAL